MRANRDVLRLLVAVLAVSIVPALFLQSSARHAHARIAASANGLDSVAIARHATFASHTGIGYHYVRSIVMVGIIAVLLEAVIAITTRILPRTPSSSRPDPTT
jgi:hypothetical protein